MGRTGHGIDKIIKKELKDENKTGGYLEAIVFEKKSPKTDKEREKIRKAFNYALNKLLENEHGEGIEIVGYVPGKPIKQSFTSHSVLFKLSKRQTRRDIKEKLIKMDEDEISYNELRELFVNKLTQLGNYEKERLDYLKSWIFYFTPKQIKDILREDYPELDEYETIVKGLDPEDKSLLYSANKKYQSQRGPTYVIPNPVKLDENEKRVSDLFDENTELASLLIDLNKYGPFSDRRIWFYPVNPMEFNDLWDHLYVLPDSQLYGGPRIEIPGDGRMAEVTLLQYIFLENYHQIDAKGNWSKEVAIKKGNFYLRDHHRNDPYSQFEHILDILSTYPPEERDILNNLLAKGLSDEKDSLKVFGTVYNEIDVMIYRKRVKAILEPFQKEWAKLWLEDIQ